MNDFRLDTKVLGKVAVLHPHGYLNNIVAERLEKECGGFLEKGFRKILLNFKDIEYINSIGISVLLGVIQSIKAAEAELCFSNLSSLHNETFEMIGLKTFMRVFRDEDEAVVHLQGGG